MSKNNFTRGPWCIQPGINRKAVHNLVIEGEMTIIATVHGSVDPAVDWYAGASRLDRNASIIAAAPDLLQCLEWMIKIYEGNAAPGLVSGPEYCASLQAIAKAKGESA